MTLILVNQGAVYLTIKYFIFIFFWVIAVTAAIQANLCTYNVYQGEVSQPVNFIQNKDG